MLHWFFEENYKAQTISIHAEKYNPDDTRKQVEAMLVEPIEGITSEERLDELEGESFESFAALMGE